MLFVAGWRHALRSEWPFIIIIIITLECYIGVVNINIKSMIFSQMNNNTRPAPPKPAPCCLTCPGLPLVRASSPLKNPKPQQSNTVEVC